MNKTFISAAVLLLLATTSCSSFKPDHPQVYKDFSNRRAPSDNAKAQSGDLGLDAAAIKKKKEAANVYKPMNTKEEAAPILEPMSDEEKPQTLGSKIQNLFSSNDTVAGPTAEEKAEAEEKADTLGSRIGKMFSSKGNPTSLAFNSSKDEWRRPGENKIVVSMEARQTAIAQEEGEGSASGYSYYESASEIIKNEVVKGHPVDKVEMTIIEPFEVAQASPPSVPTPPLPPVEINNAPPAPSPAAPVPVNAAPVEKMVTVPTIPSDQEMKKKAEVLPAPDLRNVPSTPTLVTPAAPVVPLHEDKPVMPIVKEIAKPEVPQTPVIPIPEKNAIAPVMPAVKDEVKKKEEVKPAPAAKKVVKAKKPAVKKAMPKADTSGAIDPSNIQVNDQNSTIQIDENGNYVVTGYLDMQLKSDANQ